MSYRTIDLGSGPEAETSSGPSLGSLHPSLSSDQVGPKITFISDGSDSMRIYGDSSKRETSSTRSLHALISNVGGRINRTEVPPPPRVLLEKETRDNLQIRELAKGSIKVRLRIEGRKPNDAEVLEHLNLRRCSIASEYDWVDVKVTETSLSPSIKVAINVIDVVVGDPSE